ncbi:MAG: hypothetical protein EYC70_15245 [Planctomycetota bacterium]|nr:MAG: hypothetical protein EYC70_15245 [Planctomycetota bacterium]
MLPNKRPARGWRKLTPIQGIVVAVVSDIQRQFGIPLRRQRRLLRWMLGEYQTDDQASDLAARLKRMRELGLADPRDLGTGLRIANELLRASETSGITVSIGPDLQVSREQAVGAFYGAYIAKRWPVLHLTLFPGLSKPLLLVTDLEERFEIRELSAGVGGMPISPSGNPLLLVPVVDHAERVFKAVKASDILEAAASAVRSWSESGSSHNSSNAAPTGAQEQDAND